MLKQFMLLQFICLFSSTFSSAATLQEAFQAALQKNEAVGIQNAQVDQAQERLNQVKGGVYPQISGNATYMVQPKLNDPAAQAIYPEKQTVVALTANQALFRGFREFAGIRQYKNLLSSQQEMRNQALVLLYQDVAAAYLNVLNLEQDIRNLEVQTKLYNERIGDLRGRTRRGESSSTDLLSAQANAAALEAELQVVKGNLITARENFAFMTGLPANETLIDPDLSGKVALAPVSEYLKKIEDRYDIKAAREQFEASEESVSIAKGAHWPSLDLLGNYYFKRPDSIDKDLRWDVQLRLTVPLFEGGTTQAKVREAAFKKLETDLALSRLRRQAEQEIRSYYEGYRTRLAQLATLKTSIDLSDRNYQQIRRDYRRGLVRNIDVQLALTEFRIASRTLDQARFAAQLELIRLQISTAQISAPVMKEN